MGKFLNLSDPQLPQLEKGDAILQAAGKEELRQCVKHERHSQI